MYLPRSPLNSEIAVSYRSPRDTETMRWVGLRPGPTVMVEPHREEKAPGQECLDEIISTERSVAVVDAVVGPLPTLC
jgi:hypothetical protein